MPQEAYQNNLLYQRILDILKKQNFIQLLDFQLQEVSEGRVVLSCAYNPKFTQQHGFLHAGVIATLADAAAGYAAISAASEDEEMLSAEFKLNLLRPAVNKQFLAEGVVLKKGRKLIVTEATVTDVQNGKTIAKLIATMIPVRKPDCH